MTSPTSIPEITERQLITMQQVCFDPNMEVFSQCSCKPEDDLHVAVLAKQVHDDTEYLCSLGFLKNITDDHRERITVLEKETGRTWNVYEITALGRAMFQMATSDAKN